MSTLNEHLILDRLTRWWNPTRVDHMTLKTRETDPGGAFEGQNFYIPRDNVSGTHPLYRLRGQVNQKVDHMDSTIHNEGGYINEGILGFPFANQKLGTVPLKRWYLQGQDHLTAFNEESPAGYQLEGPLGYGYPRWGNVGENTATIQTAQVKLGINLVAGGAVSKLWWGGKQFVNNSDYGRQIQVAFNLTNTSEEYNPTEAGDKYGWKTGEPNPGFAHGSPLLSYSVNGNVLETKTAPLLWKPELVTGGPDQPALWKSGTIAKRIELNYQNYANLIHWQTTVETTTNHPTFAIEIVTAHLTGDFNRFYAFKNNVLIEKTATVPNFDCLVDDDLAIQKGGVILATANGDYALGVYRNYGPGLYALCKFTDPASGNGEYDFNIGKWSALRNMSATPVPVRQCLPGLKTGTHSWTAILIVGNLELVETAMRYMCVNNWPTPAVEVGM